MQYTKKVNCSRKASISSIVNEEAKTKISLFFFKVHIKENKTEKKASIHSNQC